MVPLKFFSRTADQNYPFLRTRDLCETKFVDFTYWNGDLNFFKNFAVVCGCTEKYDFPKGKENLIFRELSQREYSLKIFNRVSLILSHLN